MSAADAKAQAPPKTTGSMFGMVLYRTRIYFPFRDLPTTADILNLKREHVNAIFEVPSKPLEPKADLPPEEWVLGLQRPGSRIVRVKKRWPV